MLLARRGRVSARRWWPLCVHAAHYRVVALVHANTLWNSSLGARRARPEALRHHHGTMVFLLLRQCI
jgi:hypothetical protein